MTDMCRKIQIPEILSEELTPTVKDLLDVLSKCIQIIEEQKFEIQKLKDEIARLKGGNPKPKIKPSTLDSDINKKKQSHHGRNSKKGKKKKKIIKIDRKKKIKVLNVPKGSTFKGYKTFIVQDIIVGSEITKYYREDWESPDGKRIVAELPKGIRGHYGAGLHKYILNLNYGLNVPQHLILEHLEELGIHISAGQLNSLLIEGHEDFHDEKECLLEYGLKIFPHVSVDDTGARHQGKNGYCTHIGNDLFAYFKSTESKSRINFLKILRGKETDYIFTQESLDYMLQQGISSSRYTRLEGALGRVLKDEEEWLSFLKMVGINNQKEIKIITEAALLGSILMHGINRDIVIVSDEAGQFDVFFIHALCWLHAERKITTIVPVNDYHLKIIEDIRFSIWEYYNALKIYKDSPSDSMKKVLELRFDEIFTQKTEFEVINKALELIYKNKKGLLLVLERPEVPLHNNESENTIRVMVTKRKIHGGTRSELGRLCRDTFMSLKKTCLKLGISFQEYLYDRLSETNAIPQLHTIMLKLAFSET